MPNRVDGLLRQANERGEKTAIRCGNLFICFADLANLVSETAGGLRAIGIGAGTHVGIMMPAQPEFVVVQQALFMLGAVISPINVYYRPNELAHAIRTCEIEYVLIASDLRDRLSPKSRQDIPSLIAAILVDSADDEPGFMALPQACRLASPVTVPAQVEPCDVVMLLNTSATTGKSKGVMLTADNLAANYDRTPEWLGLDESDVILCALPLYNTFGLNQCINAMTSTGCTLVLLPRFDAEKCIKSIERDHCTFFPAVPTMLQKILDQLGDRKFALRSLNMIMTGGAPVPAPMLARLKKALNPTARVVTGYGLTEGTALVTLTDVELGTDGEIVRGRTIGRVLDGMTLAVADDEGKILEPGKVGEFVIGGRNIMAGYYKAPEDTELALAQGLLHTGDIGYIDEDGYAFIVDRKKDVIIRGGQNIYPADIEEVLYAVDGVAEVAVIGIEDPILGEVPVAYVALAPNKKLAAEVLLAKCRDELASYKQPVAIHFMPELPKGPTGKILRREIRLIATQSSESQANAA